MQLNRCLPRVSVVNTSGPTHVYVCPPKLGSSLVAPKPNTDPVWPQQSLIVKTRNLPEALRISAQTDPLVLRRIKTELLEALKERQRCLHTYSFAFLNQPDSLYHESTKVHISVKKRDVLMHHFLQDQHSIKTINRWLGLAPNTGLEPYVLPSGKPKPFKHQ